MTASHNNSHVTTSTTDPVRRVLAEIDAKTAAFAARTGLSCPPGCGQCCTNPHVTASVTELMPLAEKALLAGDAEALHGAARAAEGRPCVLFRPESADGAKGRCGAYEERPSLCRLFGFASVRTKRPGPELAACRVMRSADPETVAHAESEARHAPLMSDYALALRAEAGAGLAAELLPINQALALAIERAALRQRAYGERTTPRSDEV